jgi:hypothetical protein
MRSRWKSRWCRSTGNGFSSTRRRHCHRQSTGRAHGHAAAFPFDLIRRHEQLFRASAGKPDLYDGRHDLATEPRGRQTRRLSTVFRRNSAARDSPTWGSTLKAVRAQPMRNGSARRRVAGPALDSRAYAALAAPSKNAAPITYKSVDPALFDAIVSETAEHGHGGLDQPTPKKRALMLGKLTWSAIPFDQPIPLITSIVLIVIILGLLAWITSRGHWPYLWREWITSVDHKRIGVMYCVLALVMLIRGFSRCHHDACAAGNGPAFAGLSAAGAFRPDISPRTAPS